MKTTNLVLQRQGFPTRNKTVQETMRCLQKFLPSDQKPGTIHTDNLLQFTRAGEDFCWNYDKSHPYRSETNGFAENAVRRVKEGTSVFVVHSGLSEMWWRGVMEYFCSLKTHKTSCRTESHRMNEDLELRLMVQCYPSGLKFSLIQSPQKTKVAFIHLRQKYFHEYSVDTR